MTLYYLNQHISKILDTTGGIDNSQTTDIALSDGDGLELAKPGIAILSYASPLDTNSAEWITYTSINAVTFKFEGVTRGAEGYGAKAHARGVIVAFPISESHINNINDLLLGVTAGIRIKPRVVKTTDDATSVIDIDTTDQYELSAVANATTISTTGTATDGQKLIIKLKDAGVAKGLTWDGIFQVVGTTLPTTTVAGKTHYIGCIYSSTSSKWEVVAVLVQA